MTVLRRIATRAGAIQAAAVAAVVALVVLVVATAVGNLSARGIPFGLEFLGNRAGFTIAESLLPYSPDDSNTWAIIVGIGNTIWISALVSVISTVIGTLLALARIGNNPLLAALAKVWIESVRNTPVLLLLIFVYTLWWVIPPGSFFQPLPGVFVSMRGVAVPRIDLGVSAPVVIAVVVAGFALLLAARRAVARTVERTGRSAPYTIIVAAIMTAALVAAVMLSGVSPRVESPRVDGGMLLGGTVLTPELATILVGLTLYTSGFIAEIVRAGLLAVPRGQWEAARALGLSARRVLALVVIPQMLRVIVPPMTSQYINVIKNSTLAIVVGYTDFMTVMGTVINKTSHAIEGTVIIVVVYLVINLSLSAVLNWYNRRVAFGNR
jgi:general L-amino acid transport system permease protein